MAKGKSKRKYYIYGRIKGKNMMQISRFLKDLEDGGEKITVLNIQRFEGFFSHYYYAFYQREVDKDQLSPYMRDTPL